jgi:hypothetical protein
MTENQRLRELLKEAREFVECFAGAGEHSLDGIASFKVDLPKDGYPRQVAVCAAADTIARIDAALAEQMDATQEGVPDWACYDCGSTDGFHTVQYPDGDYDVVCSECDSERTDDAPQVLRDLARDLDTIRAERDEARAEVERLTEALEDAEGDMHQRIRAGYDATIADCWRAKVAEVVMQRDALRIQNEHMTRVVGAAIKTQKIALADAYRRGAETMREVAADWAAQFCASGTAVSIRALPIPEDK